jgi:phage tail sheath gpL-like
MSQSLTTVNDGSIQFVEIPYTWKVPGNYMEVKPAINDNAVLPFPAQGLVVGMLQVNSSLLAMPGQAYQILSGPQADSLFGYGSVAAKMCRRWLDANPYTPLDAIGINPVTGNVQATGSVTFTGAATSAGTQAFYFGGVRVAVQINVGDTAAVVAANLAAAITQQNTTAGYTTLPSLNMTYVAGAAVVNLKADHCGTLGNLIDVRINAQTGDMTPAGITIAIAPMSGGSGDPTNGIANALAGLSKWYTDIAFAWTDPTNIATLSAWLNASYGAMAKLDCQGYVSTSGSYGTLLTFAPNCKYLSVLPVQNPLSPPWETAASFAAVCCLSTAQAPALQMKTVPLPKIKAPAGPDVFTSTENEALLLAGFSTYYTDSLGNVYLQRVANSYRVDPDGAPNFAWFDLQSTKVPTRVRYDWDNYIAQKWPRNGLAADGTLAAQFAPNVVTPRRLMSSWASRCSVYEKNGWIQNSAVTSASSSFTIDPNDGNRVNSRQQIQVMGNLIVLAGSLEFISNT